MKFVVYKDAKDEWRWRIVSSNSKTIADSGEGYSRKASAVGALRRLVKGIQAKPLTIDIEVTEIGPAGWISDDRKAG